MTIFAIDAVPHDRLTANDAARLRQLFDAEYLAEFGAWDPDQPYGYAPHDHHVIARFGDDLVGHVGWAQRTIGVGAAEVVIAGVGGVLISPRARTTGRCQALATCGVVDEGCRGHRLRLPGMPGGGRRLLRIMRMAPRLRSGAFDRSRRSAHDAASGSADSDPRARFPTARVARGRDRSSRAGLVAAAPVSKMRFVLRTNAGTRQNIGQDAGR